MVSCAWLLIKTSLLKGDDFILSKLQSTAQGNIKTKKAQTAMIPNPIYEGPLYESITQQFSTLAASVEARESRYLDNPVNSTAAREETDGTTMHGAHCQKVDDNYTVMGSVSMHMGGNGEKKME